MAWNKHLVKHHMPWLMPLPTIYLLSHIPLGLSSFFRWGSPKSNTRSQEALLGKWEQKGKKVNKRCVHEWALLWTSRAQTHWLFSERIFPSRSEETEVFIYQQMSLIVWRLLLWVSIPPRLWPAPWPNLCVSTATESLQAEVIEVGSYSFIEWILH